MNKRHLIAWIGLVVIGLYGLTSACVCADHPSSTAATTVCRHCAAAGVDATGVRLMAHHQCCGMERAPVAVEKVTSFTLSLSTESAVVHTVSLFSDTDAYSVALSTFSHAPPRNIPIYFTTQRFVI